MTDAPFYDRDGITIHNGDNCQVLQTMSAESIDLVVTSPPYDELRAYGGHSWDFESLAKHLERLVKPGGVIVWIVNDATVEGSETGSSLRQALHFMSLGLRLHDTMIYHKNGSPFPETNRYSPVWEYMFVFSKGRPKTVNLIADRKTINAGAKKKSPMERQPDGSIRRPERRFTIAEYSVRYNVWTVDAGFTTTTKDRKAYQHPAIFPERLARDPILSWSNEGDIVLDPCNGSGTTTKMARETGRIGIGIDAEELYCQIAAERLAQRGLFTAEGTADAET